jgi:predicted nucleic acid-binding Zn ribbon protein
MQSMSDDPIRSCSVCEAEVQRVFHPVAVHFKGSGFYTTDYGRKRGAASDSGGDTGGESKSETKGDAKGDTKSDSKGDSSKTAASKTSDS